MIKKVDLSQTHHEVFGNPAPLGLLGLAIACAALTPIAFGYSLTREGFGTAAVYCMLFGALCQLLAGLMDFANRNAFGGTIFTAFAFNWAINGFTFFGLMFGFVPDHTIVLSVETVLFVIFLFLTYGFGFFSKGLFLFLLDIDMLYACKLIKGFSGTTALNIPIAILTVLLGIYGLWIALAGLMNPLAGREMFPIGGPLFERSRRRGFDWSLRRVTFEILYKHWKDQAFEEMAMEDLFLKVKAAAPLNLRATLTREKLLPELCYLMEYGSLKATFADETSKSMRSARLTASGIDLYEQLILRKYEF